MKPPIPPPSFDELFQEHIVKHPEKLKKLFAYPSLTDPKGKYAHWDRLRHLPCPEGLSSEEWWLAIKLARKNQYRETPFLSKNATPFVYTIPDRVMRELSWLDLHAGGSVSNLPEAVNPEARRTFLIRAFIDEAISSSQLEGAVSTRAQARELLHTKRPVRNKSEQMIVNNYQAMEFIKTVQGENLTPETVLELHRRLTINTLPEDECGRLRKPGEQVHVVDNRDGEFLHTAPAATELPRRMKTLCAFANGDDSRIFIHPLIKAIILHFMLAYDHPFSDGNGRTARALFYWAAARYGYWLMEYLQISTVIKSAPAQYWRAYLYTEKDDNDLTYFIDHQIGVIRKAIENLGAAVKEKEQEIKSVEQLLSHEKWRALSYRQKYLLRHALRHPGASYTIQEHRTLHDTVYETARKDLMELASLGLLEKHKVGNAYHFIAPHDLRAHLDASALGGQLDMPEQ